MLPWLNVRKYVRLILLLNTCVTWVACVCNNLVKYSNTMLLADSSYQPWVPVNVSWVLKCLHKCVTHHAGLLMCLVQLKLVPLLQPVASKMPPWLLLVLLSTAHKLPVVLVVNHKLFKALMLPLPTPCATAVLVLLLDNNLFQLPTLLWLVLLCQLVLLNNVPPTTNPPPMYATQLCNRFQHLNLSNKCTTRYTRSFWLLCWQMLLPKSKNKFWANVCIQ